MQKNPFASRNKHVIKDKKYHKTEVQATFDEL